MAKKGAEKLWTRQGQALQDEAAKAGSRLVYEEMITADLAGGGGAAARSSMTSLLGGSLQIRFLFPSQATGPFLARDGEEMGKR